MKLSKTQQKKIKEIAEKNQLDLVLLFGSVVTGKLHPRSDIDIAVRFKDTPSIDYKKIGDVHFDLQEAFDEAEVDIVVLNFADPLLLKRIMDDAQLIFGTSRQYADLKILAFKKYVDHQKYFQMERKFVKRFLAGKRKEVA